LLDLPKEADDNAIYAVLENKRLDGGPVERLSRLSDTTALVTFHDKTGMLIRPLLAY